MRLFARNCDLTVMAADIIDSIQAVNELVVVKIEFCLVIPSLEYSGG